MISLTAKYALRALAELALLPEGVTMVGKELSQRSGVPSNYLSKILWSLGSEDLIAATRGIRGGYRLVRPAEEIRLIEIVRPFDKPRARQSCFLHEFQACSDSEPCSAHDAWALVGEANHRFLEVTTLADISRKNSKPKRRRHAG